MRNLNKNEIFIIFTLTHTHTVTKTASTKFKNSVAQSTTHTRLTHQIIYIQFSSSIGKNDKIVAIRLLCKVF